MNARQIEVFRTIMRCGTLTGAAQALHVSQPALSQLLLHAEDQLGFKLFQRLGGRLVPTPEATQLYPEAERLHHDLESFRRYAADLRQGQAGTVRLGSSSPPALSFLPLALRQFRALCPGMRLVSFVVPMEVLAEKLERGEVDLGIALHDAPQAMIQAELIGRTEVVCLLPARHPLAAEASLGIADLAGETLISYRADSLPGARLEAAFAREGARLRPAVEIDVSLLALSFVQQGIGLALVDGLIPWAGFPGVVARPFHPRVALPVSILTSARRPLSHTQEQFRGEIRRALALYAAAPEGRGLVQPAA
ncbi:LysR family transcriptional regulator [Roseomonas sp. GC11]|uniref:LysR family transcriptional regulator n=1 Tax=Roseomonas sp. GC11 TaxID=2950546 RepID=UPI0021086021|nr:LysR family transcriptional regulator [Roseomonas sp. GC11]MCQ4159529.1 LysR family transcriptional regulator [Roseomonas sp. GC11]